ncbi:MAG: T9SS type A sorting domain-containing protein [bacterium]|nr:T9SS type A sorting domain-containing protein [bacterium]
MLSTKGYHSNNDAQTSRKTNFTFYKQGTFNFENAHDDFQAALMVREMPKQGSSKMEPYNYPSAKEIPQPGASQKPATLPDLIKGQSFVGNPFGLSTPCDNDLAISDSGFVVSVMNTNIFVKNIATGTNYPVKTLAAFTLPINNKHQEFDPKVMYDPLYDRFVLMCMVGNVDTTSKMIVGFSQTSNPTGSWNLYTLPGNALNNGLWSDYPMIAMTEKELFLSVNLLYNDSSWQTGFVETIVWQMDKKKGYAGQPLSSTLHSNIKFNGKAVRNLCPAKGGSKLYKPNMYFVSNRNLASQNDTVFLVNITDTINAPTNTVTVKALTTNQSYFFPPNGRQTTPTQSLATNDCRNLGAFYENNKIQYVHNTKNPANNHVTIYYGVIDNPQSVAPLVSGYLLPNDTMDFAYPNISYAGRSTTDQTSIITFDHSSNKINPGVSAMQADGAGNFSKVLRIQNGYTYVNLLTNNLERWGDYSGSQRRYNKPGEVWMSGYYGYYYSGSFPWTHAAWIAQLTTSVTIVDTTGISSEKEKEISRVSVYPNPASDVFSVSFAIPKPEYLSFELFNSQGSLVAVLLRDWVKFNENVFSFKTGTLPKGVYLLKISGNYGSIITKNIIIN